MKKQNISQKVGAQALGNNMATPLRQRGPNANLGTMDSKEDFSPEIRNEKTLVNSIGETGEEYSPTLGERQVTPKSTKEAFSGTANSAQPLQINVNNSEKETASRDQWQNDSAYRKREQKVVLPQKGSSRSQYVEREKMKKAKDEKDKVKQQQKKKFINMSLNSKKFNGVVLGSDSVLDKSIQNLSNANHSRSNKKTFDSDMFAKSANMRFHAEKKSVAEQINSSNGMASTPDRVQNRTFRVNQNGNSLAVNSGINIVTQNTNPKDRATTVNNEDRRS